MTYGEAVRSAAESLAFHWREVRAGRAEVAAYSEAHAAARIIARKHRLPFRTVWDAVREDAAKLFSA